MQNKNKDKFPYFANSTTCFVQKYVKLYMFL